MRKSAAYTHPLWGYGIYKYEVYQDGVSGVSWYCREGMKEEGRCGLTPHALHCLTQDLKCSNTFPRGAQEVKNARHKP